MKDIDEKLYNHAKSGRGKFEYSGSPAYVKDVADEEARIKQMLQEQADEREETRLKNEAFAAEDRRLYEEDQANQAKVTLEHDARQAELKQARDEHEEAVRERVAAEHALWLAR